MSSCARHVGSKPQTRVCLDLWLFCVHATSLSGNDVISTHLSCVLFLTVRLKTVSRTVASSQLRMARNPLVRVQLWLSPKFGTKTNTLTQSGRLRRLCGVVRFLEEPALHPAPANTAVASTAVNQSLKSQRPCGRTQPVHRNVFGYATTLIRWTGSKRSRPMPTNRHILESQLRGQRAEVRRVRREQFAAIHGGYLLP